MLNNFHKSRCLTWVWASPRSWWWTGRPGVLWLMGSQSQTRLSNWTDWPSPGDLPYPGIKPYHASRFCSSRAITKAQEYWSEAYLFSSTSSQTRNWIRISCIAGGFFTSWTARESQHTQRVRTNQGSKLFISIVMLSICIYFVPSVIWAVCCTASIKAE